MLTAALADQWFGLLVIAIICGVFGFHQSHLRWQDAAGGPPFWIIIGMGLLAWLAFGWGPFLPRLGLAAIVLAGAFGAHMLGWAVGKRLRWQDPARYERWTDHGVSGRLYVRGKEADLYLEKHGRGDICIDAVTFCAPGGCTVEPRERHSGEPHAHEGATMFPAPDHRGIIEVLLHLERPEDAARITAQIVWHRVASGLRQTTVVRSTNITGG